MTACNDTPNTNCLIGFRCPHCGSFEPFSIEVTTMLTVHDNGGGDTETLEWDDDSRCICIECGLAGTVATFTAVGGGP
jgi:hypothetical protein